MARAVHDPIGPSMRRTADNEHIDVPVLETC